MKNKKAQILGNLSLEIISIVVAVIILVMGVVILQSIRDVDTLTTAETSNFVNETTTIPVNVTNVSLVCANQPASICTVTQVFNRSSSIEIPSSNFTVTPADCTIAYNDLGDGQGFNNSFWNVTYSCTHGGAAFTTTNASVIAVGDFSDFIPIIVIALAASVIIGLILVGFTFTRRNR